MAYNFEISRENDGFKIEQKKQYFFRENKMSLEIKRIWVFENEESWVLTYFAIVSLSWKVFGPDPVVSRLMIATSMCLILMRTSKK